jgi:ABC-type glycerol-3-phosphate transport system permease component
MQTRTGYLAYAFLIACSAFVLLPLLWAFSTSLKDVAGAAAYPPTWIPTNPTLSNYAEIVTNPKLIQYFLNTIEVGGTAIIIAIVLGAPAAYAVERGAFAGRNQMMSILWATNMLGGVAVVLPLYLVSTRLGIYDTKFALILVYAGMTVPTVVWLLRGFVARIPVEIEQAALLDGCNRFTAFVRITLPLMRPGIFASAAFVFITIWNDFLIAYGLAFQDKNRLIQVGIYFFVTETGVRWGPMMAAVLLTALPILILYSLSQRPFTQGSSSGAVNE